jgi:hypothetical protein
MLGLDTGIDGVIGLPMFKDYLTVFEPLSKRIVLRSESLGSANGADILSYTAPDGIPDMEMQVGGQAQPMHLDSGNPGCLSLNKSMTTNLEWIVPPEEIGKAMTVSNTFSIYEGRLKSDLRLGKYVLEQPFVTVVDVGNHINFGFGAFRQFSSVSFDQTNHRVRFENDSTTIVLPAEGKHGPKGH